MLLNTDKYTLGQPGVETTNFLLSIKHTKQANFSPLLVEFMLISNPKLNCYQKSRFKNIPALVFLLPGSKELNISYRIIAADIANI